MGLVKFFKSIFGEKNKKYESPDVKFIDDDSSEINNTIPINVFSPTQQIIIKSNDEYLVFNSKDDIPAEMLEEINHLDDLGTVDSFSVIVDGQRQIYSRFEDIPEEVRNAINKMDK